MEYIQPYLDYFTAHPDWAIALIFLIAFGEALLIIGLFVPSTAVLVGAGILVGTGHLQFWPVFFATFLGAVLGDQVSYWAGRLFGTRLKTLWPLRSYPQLVARGEDFVRLHGGKSIAIGRFVPGVKSVVPGVVGMLGMGQVYFAIVNFLSSIVWSIAHIAPGILIGQGLAFAGELSGRLVVVLLILLVILAVAAYLIRLVVAGISPYLGHLLGSLSAWARRRPSRSMQRFARAVEPSNPRSTLVVLFAAVAFGGLLLLLNMVIKAVSTDAVSNMDLSVFNLLKEMRNAPADELMITLTMLGDGVVMTLLAASIFVWLIWHKAYRAAIAAAIAIVAGKLFIPLLSLGIDRPRPIDMPAGYEFFSFPSSHATTAVIIFGILAVLVSHSFGRWGRALVFAILSILVIAIAFSRVYLGVHWLSDVLAGLIFGSIMVAAFGVAIEAIPPRRIKPVGLFGVALLVFIVAGIAHVSMGYGKAEALYQPPRMAVNLAPADWRQGGWEKLQARRIDLGGKSEEVFFAQYAGDLDVLKQVLAGAGWKDTGKWTWRQSIPYLNPAATLDDLPPRPNLHQGLKALLTMVHGLPDGQRLVIRLYKSDFVLAGEGATKPVYFISLMRETRREGFNLYAIPSPLPVTPEDQAMLREALANAPVLAVVATSSKPGLPQQVIVSRP